MTHPTTQKALEQSGGDRARAREVIREAIMAEARWKADAAGRSFKCRSDMHAEQGSGCRNDGSNCICICHDLQVAP